MRSKTPNEVKFYAYFFWLVRSLCVSIYSKIAIDCAWTKIRMIRENVSNNRIKINLEGL